MKRRTLLPDTEVVIIYDVDIGFVQESAVFKEYRPITLNGTIYNTPVFTCKNKEISGISCFWALPHEVRDISDVHNLQYELISTQLVVSQVANQMGYNIPQKIHSKELIEMANEKNEQRAALIKKFGFDPTDDSWIENDLAQTIRERKWFKFERENRLIFHDNWDEIIDKYNRAFGETLTVEEAKALSKKRMRYILGSHNLRYRGDKDKKKWAFEARQFEQMHKAREERMLVWSNKHLAHFPLVRVKKPVRFFTGQYFNECIERIPNFFVDTGCQYIKPDIVLRVVSYDPQDKYIRLDFTHDTRQLIKGPEKDSAPWNKESLDYDIWVKPSEIESHLELLEPLE